jgi:alpha/beta hydrolase fold.
MTKKNLKKINYQNLSIQLNTLINFLSFTKMNLISFSIGSLIALQFCNNFKKKINKLVLISSVYKRSKKEKDLVFSKYQLALNRSSISNIAIKR